MKLPRKLCHDDVSKTGIVDTVDFDTIRSACRLDYGVSSMLADQRQRLAYQHLVSAVWDLDLIVALGCSVETAAPMAE
jgi:hypothetical protein